MSHILDAEKHVILTKVLPEIINGILTGLRDLSDRGPGEDEKKTLELNSRLREMRPHFLYIVEAHRSKVSKINEDAYNELVEMITSAVLSILSENIVKVKYGTIKEN